MNEDIFSCQKCKRRVEDTELFLVLDKEKKATKLIQICSNCQDHTIQPERSKREDSPEDNGYVKKICFAYKCGQPVFVRGWQVFDQNKPLLCGECWLRVYSYADYDGDINNDTSASFRQRNILKHIKNIISNPDSTCEMRCSEHCGNTVREVQ